MSTRKNACNQRRPNFPIGVRALDEPASVWRCFFLTGTRGSGKTSQRGMLKFALPHYEYVFEDYAYTTPEVEDDEWDF